MGAGRGLVGPGFAGERSGPRGPGRPGGRRDGRVVAESSETEHRARPTDLPTSLDPGLVEALRAVGIERLYSHQREAMEAASDSNLIITSGTASGKSLAFNLPVLDG